MAIEIKKRDNESMASFMRRFTRRVQQSGVLIEARRRRFRTAPKNRQQKRLAALHRAVRQKEVERLKKLGKFEEKKRFFRR